MNISMAYCIFKKMKIKAFKLMYNLNHYIIMLKIIIIISYLFEILRFNFFNNRQLIKYIEIISNNKFFYV